MVELRPVRSLMVACTKIDSTRFASMKQKKHSHLIHRVCCRNPRWSRAKLKLRNTKTGRNLLCHVCLYIICTTKLALSGFTQYGEVIQRIANKSEIALTGGSKVCIVVENEAMKPIIYYVTQTAFTLFVLDFGEISTCPDGKMRHFVYDIGSSSIPYEV